MEKTKIVGQTKDAGFQIGVRKTYPVPLESTWGFLFSKAGLSIWLDASPDELTLDSSYKTTEDVEGKVSTLKPYSHIRLTWKPKTWTNVSHLQLRLIASKDKTTISFHQDRLLDTSQRAAMKAHWEQVLEEITKHLAS